jgi:release factor glutamine methyltransferase
LAPIHIADIGTGSGILAVCAAMFLPAANVTAIDISREALAVARRNAERHNVAERIVFVESDLFAAVPVDARFDYIVSNPPYVSNSEMQQLPLDVRDYEPEIALRAGEKGTDVIAPLIEQSVDRLQAGGALFIEISPMIAEEVEKRVAAQSSLELGTTIKDLAGLARIVRATRRDC